ncbi:MAG: PAS domain-containing protein, partial [Cyanobacteria bacterium]|nr:PAS domain-containing protein [Cyanobacteriota bacterium]
MILAQMAQETWQSDRVQIWWEPPTADSKQLHCVADTGAIGHDNPGGLSSLAIDALMPLWPETVDTFSHLLAKLEDPIPLGSVLSPGVAPSAVLMVAVQSDQGAHGLILGERHPRSWEPADIWAGRYLGQRLARAADRRALSQMQMQLSQQTQVTQRLETELGQATQAWQESQVFIQGIVSSSPCVIYVYDNLIDRVIYSNGELFQQLGYNLTEISQMPGPFLQERIHPEDIAKADEQRRQWLEDTAADILQLQYRVLLPNGDWRWLLIREAILTAD